MDLMKLAKFHLHMYPDTDDAGQLAFRQLQSFFINLYTPLSLEELPEGVKDYSEYYMKEYGKKKDSEVKEYTASWLLQDLQRQIELEEENAKQKGKDRKNTFYDKSILRDKQHKLKVLNFLLNLNVENVDKKEEVEDFVKMLVSQNEPLFGFTFSCHLILILIITGVI